MKISFIINYHTSWGESLYISGDIPALGSGNPHEAVEMSLTSPDTWQLTIETADNTPAFDYSFIVKAPEKAWRLEWGKPHRFIPGHGITKYSVFDSWHDLPHDKPFYSSAFVDGMLRRPQRDTALLSLPGSLSLRVENPIVAPDEVMAIAGEGNALGNWNQQQALLMNDAHFPVWEANISFRDIKGPFSYKFVVVKKDTGEVVRWEQCPNRIYGIESDNDSEQVVIDGLRFANSGESWKGAGTAIPVFSIRTDEDFGIGDFADIRSMIDWCVATGQKILQLLPINDTTMTGTWVDSYPYKANSIFALHPMYLRLQEVGELADESRREYYRKLGAELNELPQIDYERVNDAKHEYLREIYAQNGEITRNMEEYREFMTRNSWWLKPYAAWSVLRDEYHTPDNNLWGPYSKYDEATVDAFIEGHRTRIEYYFFLQFHLDRQLRATRDYAHDHGVVLKGDIPIGISRFSVDAWTDPRLFNMDCQAGAPPDDFSVLGQNWGFPTYNWEEMARDGFRWWKDRFRKMAEYFDAYRIDHILGFFRIWEIPLNAIHGLLGYFNPALPFSPEELREKYDFWIDPDRQTHPLILEWMLDDFFGEYKEEARSRFLDHVGGDRWCLKQSVDTQEKVVALFADAPNDEKNNRLRNALLGIIDDVLFIEDPRQKGHYHPRIAAQYTYQFRILTDYEKWSFNRLYNDFFYHRHNDFWYGKAMWKLPPLLDATSMLCCAEDLGMIPDCVPSVMHQLEILSLEIQRMPKDPHVEFGDTWHYPYYSVCTSSTHDMPGIRGWWEQDRNVTNDFYHKVLHEHGEAPVYAEPWICDKIVDLQLQSPSMLCILPLQDWLSTDADIRRENPMDEVINEPANSRHYWRYRMHLTVEALMLNRAFNESMRNRIAGSHR